jgi:hypothetical protein
MYRHWERKVFKDGFISYDTGESTLIGYGAQAGYFPDSEEKAYGDLVFFTARKREDGGKDAVVMLAICTDGVFIKKPKQKPLPFGYYALQDPPPLPYEDYVDMTQDREKGDIDIGT